MRRAFQRAMPERFVAVVEEPTGRRWRAFISKVSLDPDISAEAFVLERPDGGHATAPEGAARPVAAALNQLSSARGNVHAIGIWRRPWRRS